MSASQKSTIVRTIQAAAPVASALAPSLASRWLEQLFTTPTRYAMPDRERFWMAEARVERVSLDAGRALPLYVWPGDGPTVLLVHGWSGAASQMGVFADPLRDMGFRVVAFDQPAHGQADGKRSALPEFALALERVVQAIGPVYGVISHSLGAAATTIAAARGLGAERLVQIAPPEDLPGYLARLAGFLGFSAEVAAQTQRRLEARFGLPFEMARGVGLAPSIQASALIIHDEADREVPFSEGARLAACWPKARMMTTKGLGHHRILRDPGVVEAAVQFIAEPQPEAGLNPFIPALMRAPWLNMVHSAAL